MKIKSNTTHWSDAFLRRVISWCCKQVGCPVRDIKVAAFGKRSRGAYNGCAWLRQQRIRVVIGPESAFPSKPRIYPGRTSEAFRAPAFEDQLEALVGVTVHEVTHIRDRNRAGQHGERRTRHEERKAVETFREQREQLVAEWSEPIQPRATKPKPTRAEKNEANTRKLLATWERKLKLAQNKVKKYRTKVRRYDRIAANRGGTAK